MTYPLGLQRQKNNDSQPVKHVVNRGTCKRPPEVADVRDLTNGDKRVRNGSSDVGTHHDRDSLSDVQD